MRFKAQASKYGKPQRGPSELELKATAIKAPKPEQKPVRVVHVNDVMSY